LINLQQANYKLEADRYHFFETDTDMKPIPIFEVKYYYRASLITGKIRQI